MVASLLRRRFLATLATSGLVAACGGETTTPSTGSSGSSGASSSGTSGTASSSGTSGTASSSGSSGTSSGTPPATCTNGQKERTCFAPDGIITKNSGYGGVRDPDAAPPPPPTRTANGCVVLEEVMSSCCNAAVAGPTLEDGKCCYEFCAGSCCGRPLVVAGVARVAPAAVRWDWAFANAPIELDGPLRIALRDDWTRDALMEHASIASFAAFTLELLALGAPPDLVTAAHAATADEIEHARLTFAIASSYGDVPVGPGPLDIRGIAPSSNLAHVAAACVRDGCVNETLASAIAAAQAEHAKDPELKATLERIAEDEARHAELAWRFVQWALSTGREDVRAAVLLAFDAPANLATPALPPGVDPGMWHAHGRLLPSEQTALARTIMEQVVGPCRALLVHVVSTDTTTTQSSTFS